MKAQMTKAVGFPQTNVQTPKPLAAPTQQETSNKPSSTPIADTFERIIYSPVTEVAAAASFTMHTAMVLTAPWWLDAIPAVGTTGDLACAAAAAVLSGIALGHIAGKREEIAARKN